MNRLHATSVALLLCACGPGSTGGGLSSDAVIANDTIISGDTAGPAPPELARDIARARETLKARFHGLLVGGRSDAMAALCDHVHRFTSWAGVRG